MKLIYISSPYSGDPKANADKARIHSRMAVLQGFIPVTPHIYFPQFMDDTAPAGQELSMHMNLQLLLSCSEVWVFGTYLSTGMEREIKEAIESCITIRLFLKEVLPMYETKRRTTKLNGVSVET